LSPLGLGAAKPGREAVRGGRRCRKSRSCPHSA
jgi:hypothetical protein